MSQTVHNIEVTQLRHLSPSLRFGDRVLLTGIIYTARDAAHKLLLELLENGAEAPFPLADCVIYYAGPTPAKYGMPIGSCGPTTSSRMDAFSPALMSLGMAAMIGKGDISVPVINKLIETGAVYLCAVGGAGALISKHIIACEEVAFPELGCESIKRLTVKALPLTVAVDCLGGNIFNRKDV